MAARIRIISIILAGTGLLARKKGCTRFVATKARQRRSAFPTQTAAGMVRGTLPIQPGAAARRLCRQVMAWACSIALQLIERTQVFRSAGATTHHRHSETRLHDSERLARNSN